MAYVPGQKVRIKQPSRITLAKVLAVIALLAMVYFGWVFIPPYYGYYRAASIMRDESSKAYSLRHQKAGWAELESKIHRRVRNRLSDILAIPSDQLSVRVQKKPNHIVISAHWSVYARWPFLNKRSLLKFKQEVNTSLR